MKNITILRKIPNPNDIQIAEALLLKENKPTLTVTAKTNSLNGHLEYFK